MNLILDIATILIAIWLIWTFEGIRRELAELNGELREMKAQFDLEYEEARREAYNAKL